ncbi:hypothetical protein J8M51_02940 [Streptomyces scabiei]|nr:hypothetical protein [Streptomyces griseiscabiei]
MRRAPNTMDPPPFLGLPPAEPQPTADCRVCADWARQRGEARARDDFSRVSDFNVLIRGHHPPRRKRRKV